MRKQSFILNPLLWSAVCLTLGLAPFTPEPHIWEKLKWILAGTEGMRPVDWFDFFLHGTPWVLLVVSLIYKINSKKN